MSIAYLRYRFSFSNGLSYLLNIWLPSALNEIVTFRHGLCTDLTNFSNNELLYIYNVARKLTKLLKFKINITIQRTLHICMSIEIAININIRQKLKPVNEMSEGFGEHLSKSRIQFKLLNSSNWTESTYF